MEKEEEVEKERMETTYERSNRCAMGGKECKAGNRNPKVRTRTKKQTNVEMKRACSRHATCMRTTAGNDGNETKQNEACVKNRGGKRERNGLSEPTTKQNRSRRPGKGTNEPDEGGA